ncbi:MAG: DUF3467 domain-containing protein [Desulfobacteraceae bacterium]|nr:DUF3467 domain-containing protein [Desulfobacteraceae bacterium]
MAVKKTTKTAKRRVSKLPAKKVANNQKVVREQIEVHAKPEDLAGGYSNFAIFKHSKREFIADFVWRMENTNILVSRIITSPQQAKAIHRALGQNIQNYEKTHGKIKED